jgi:membrane protease YdiL (CAAX protease family)
LLTVALIVGWLLGNSVWLKFKMTVPSVLYAVAFTVPMLIFLLFVNLSQFKGFVEIREMLRDLLGKPLAACNALDLCALALLAGVSEEFLFRGVIEPWISPRGPWVALIVTNLLFGLCHAVTRTYFVLAALMGAYLSTTLWWSDEPNLFIPVFCHSAYDLVAFYVVRRSYLQHTRQIPTQPVAVEQ